MEIGFIAQPPANLLVATTLGITTFCKTTLGITTSAEQLIERDTQHNDRVVMQNAIMLSVIMLNVANYPFMLNVVMLSVVAPSTKHQMSVG
jgi:hypothetical protein